MPYQLIDVNTNQAIGNQINSLPPMFIGLSSESLRNLNCIQPPVDGYKDRGYVMIDDPIIIRTPTQFFINKVFFQRRFRPTEWAALDVIRLTVNSRTPDWYGPNATTQQKQLLPLVYAFDEYDSATSINLLDTNVITLVGSLALLGVFGSDSTIAQQRAQSIVNPVLLPGETLSN